MLQTFDLTGDIRKNRKVTDLSKYVDFFGSSDSGSIANAKINEMLEEIESLYNNESLPYIIQILVYDKDCEHCKASLPWWDKDNPYAKIGKGTLTEALEKRLKPKYQHTKAEIMETVVVNGTPLYIGNRKMTGGLIYTMYKSTGVPFVLQNFKIERIMKRGIIEKKLIVSAPFHISHTGDLQPFSFLSSIFEIPNKWMDSRIKFM